MTQERKIADKYGYLYKVSPDTAFAIRFVDNNGTPNEPLLKGRQKKAVEAEFARRLRLEIDQCLRLANAARAKRLVGPLKLGKRLKGKQELLENVQRTIATFSWKKLQSLHKRCLQDGKGMKYRKSKKRRLARRSKTRKLRK